MRLFASLCLLLVALACVFLFAAGVQTPPWQQSTAEFLERVSSPFRGFSLFSVLLLAVSLLALLCALTCWKGRARCAGKEVPARSWVQTLEIAFLLNVILVAAIALLLWFFSSSGLSAKDPRSLQSVGVLFVAGLLEGVVGSALAITLLFLHRAKAIYFSALGAHVAEILVFTTIFVLGANA